MKFYLKVEIVEFVEFVIQILHMEVVLASEAEALSRGEAWVRA